MKTAPGVPLAAAAAALALAAPARAAEPAPRLVDPAIYDTVTHVGWVVRDLDDVVSYWKRIGLAGIREVGVRELPEVEFRGEPAPGTAKVAIAGIGGVTIVWLEPPSGARDACREFLDRHGDGIHHLAYSVPTLERLERELAGFAERGVGVVQRGRYATQRGEGHYAYLDTAPRGGGVTFALVYDPDRAAGEARTETATHEPPFRGIVQYGIAVRDLRAVSDYYAEIGFGGFAIDPHHVFDDLTYGGRPSHYEMDVGWDRRGDVAFEWIESTVGPNVYEDAIEARGEGFHHLAFDVDDMDAAIARFAERGVKVSQSGAWNFPSTRGRYAYLDTDSHGGVIVELLWNDPDWPAR